MVVGVFPALKLGVLFIKQISKPLAKVLINQAKSHPVFRTYFIIPPAQFYHWAEVKTKMYVMNLGKPTKVSKLNEDMAIELGANLLGEVIIFSVAGGCLILEYTRQQIKETKKEDARQQQLEKFTSDIQALFETVKKQESQIKYLNTVIEEVNKKKKIILTPIDAPSNSKGNETKEEKDRNNNRNGNESVVERAIEYYVNDVKADKPS